MLGILDDNIKDSNGVKKVLSNYINKKVTIKYYLGRNKYETENVIIKGLYDFIFVVENINNHCVKSFSYSDVIIKIVKIYEI